MAEKILNAKVLQRIDTLANWNASNPVLCKGEICIISDTNEIKIGDGTSTFKNLKAVTISGNAGSADKVNNKLTLKVKSGTTEGTDLYTFDGSSAKTLDIKQGTNVTLTAASGSLTIAAKDTTYTANNGISLSGTTFSNSGVRSITAGTTANKLVVNTNGINTTLTVNNVEKANAAGKIVASNISPLSTSSSVQDFMNFCIIASGGTIS